MSDSRTHKPKRLIRWLGLLATAGLAAALLSVTTAPHRAWPPW